MSPSTRDETRARRYTSVGPDATDLERYGAVSLEDGASIIFDTQVTEAWFQSDEVVGLDRVV